VQGHKAEKGNEQISLCRIPTLFSFRFDRGRGEIDLGVERIGEDGDWLDRDLRFLIKGILRGLLLVPAPKFPCRVDGKEFGTIGV
jgi:hypothetical protein